MFKKGPDIDKKKLLAKASDVKKDSLTRLKHFKTLIEHLDYNEITSLFNTHFSFIYHTFIDTFSNFDCNSKHRREDLDCLLFMLENILVYNSKLVKKRWQFYSITFVMQKLLHQDNTHKLRQEGVRLFILWYEILCDDNNVELQTMFSSIVPGLISPSQLASLNRLCQLPPNSPQGQPEYHQYPDSPQLPIKLCSVDPLIGMSPNEQLPTNETSFYLECLLHYMVTQTTKPFWSMNDESSKNHEQSFSFLFNMFKRTYMQSLFPNINQSLNRRSRRLPYDSINQYVDDPIDTFNQRSHIHQSNEYDPRYQQSASSWSAEPLQQQSHLSTRIQSDQDQEHSLSAYQAIVIRWLTRILRQDFIPGQDELIRSGGTFETKEFQPGSRDFLSNQQADVNYLSENPSTATFQTMESNSSEMEIARQVLGAWPENIAIVHEIFRRAFLNFFQPASMKRVVNVYKEWICNGKPTNQAGVQQPRLGYTSFGDLLQVFVLNSSNAFLTKVHSPALLDEQVEMCKRIMNIYRYMVMKIYMNTATWEQLLTVMLSITEHLFPIIPPEQKENTIGGRIAPAFFQTFIVSWIRANLYVHISSKMWNHFHQVMKNLIMWRELIDEWSTTMSSLTRVLVKHVYGLNLSDLPLDKPQDRRKRTRAIQSYSMAGALTSSSTNQQASQLNPSNTSHNSQQTSASRVADKTNLRSASFVKEFNSRLTRSNSEGFIYSSNAKIYHSYQKLDCQEIYQRIRKIKSECLLYEAISPSTAGRRSSSPSHTDVIDDGNMKEPTLIIDQVIESQIPPRPPNEPSKNAGKKQDKKINPDKCVLLGGTVRGWTPENSVIMWRRMLGLFGNINNIENPENHLIAIKCLAIIICEFIKARENLGISIDNQSTPELPNLIPPYTYHSAWLLEATHLPKEYQQSRLTAYKLLCLLTIRRHDIEPPPNYFSAFYEALYRGLNSSDPLVHESIIKNSAKILSLELPGSTFLVNSLFEKCRAILLNSPREAKLSISPRDQATQLIHTILALHRPIRKLMVLKQDPNNLAMTLVALGDIKTKIFDTFLACNARPLVFEDSTRCRSLFSLALHVYQELSEKPDCPEVEKLFDILSAEIQDPISNEMFRISCDLVRLFSDHALSLANHKPNLVTSIIRDMCQLVVKLGASPNKESLNCLLLCLEDWCVSVGKTNLLKTIDTPSPEEDDVSSNFDDESLISLVLSSLDAVIHGDSFSEAEAISKLRISDINSLSQSARTGSFAESSSSIFKDRTMTSEAQNLTNSQSPMNLEEIDEKTKTTRLACKASRLKLLTYLGHYPFRHLGPASLSCSIIESDFVSDKDLDSSDSFVQEMSVLVIGGDTIISFIGSGPKDNGDLCQAHLILRNSCGKYSWDANRIEPILKQSNEANMDSIAVDPDTFQLEDMRSSMRYDSDMNEDGNSSSSLSSRSSTYRDQISDILNQLTTSSTSGSSLTSNQSIHKKRNSALSVTNSKYKVAQAEETMIALLVNQRFQELNYCERTGCLDHVVLKLGHKFSIDNQNEYIGGSCEHPIPAFDQCRQLIQQLGYLSWEKRAKVECLRKSGRLIRELKNLDSQPSRETHKIAVIYVANGQEDKQSILSNTLGSRAFEDFVSGLGWDVNLASHLGFKGGLQANKSTGETSPYYCNSSTEVMFHVSTRIPINGPTDDESLNRKLRHLGNDEIHIIWSEHNRDYRRGIIPTEFGDVIIAIYPMLTFHGYYRIQIISKPEVPLFGPLFDNCIVHQTSLASLVRATAINASRAKRLDMPHYLSNYEERSRLIEAIVQNHKAKLSFEDFAVQLYQLDNYCPVVRNDYAQDAPCCS